MDGRDGHRGVQPLVWQYKGYTVELKLAVYGCYFREFGDIPSRNFRDFDMVF